jgi:fumarate reductase subunit C
MIGFRPSRYPSFVPWGNNPVIIFFNLKTVIVVLAAGANF